MVEYWNIRMALRLLYEKSLGDASSWKAYLDVMPASFSTPLNWCSFVRVGPVCVCGAESLLL